MGGPGLLLVRGLLYFYPELDAQTYQIENAIGFGAGSFCFFMGGLLLYVQMSLREQRAPPLHTALPITAELSSTLGSDQGSMHGGSVRGSSPSHGFDGVNALRL